MKKVVSIKLSDSEQVSQYLENLVHPLKDLILAVRNEILSSHTDLNERIKWNAPSYYFQEDILTFNHRQQKFVQIVIHHPSIIEIDSKILIGDYKDRRLVHFDNQEMLEQNKTEFKLVINQIICKIQGF